MCLEPQKMFSFFVCLFFFCSPLPVQFLGIRQLTIAGVRSLIMSFLILMLVFFTFLGLLQMMCSDVPMLSLKIRYCIQVRKSNLERLTIYFLQFQYFYWVAHVCVFFISLWVLPWYLTVVTCTPHFSGSLSLLVFISFPDFLFLLSSGRSLPWQPLLPLFILFSIFLSCWVCL